MLFFLLLWSINLSAQTLSEQDKSDIKARLGEYFEFTKANDYNNMMDYVYPKIYTLATKEQLVAVFSSLESLGIGLKVGDIVMNSLEPLMESGDKKFAVVDYNIDIKLELLTAEMQTEQVVESLKSSFKASYNAKDMAYDNESKVLSFNGHKYVLCVKDPDHDGDNWYFLEYDTSNPMAAQMLLDTDVLEKFIEKMGL